MSGYGKVLTVLFCAVVAVVGLGTYATVHADNVQDVLGESGRFCKNNNAFSYEMQEDGSMNFGLSFWFESGANCGVTGNATRTDSGWRYEAPRNNEKQDPPGCTIDIAIEGEYITFSTDPVDDCQDECGARGYLHGMSVPLEFFEGRLESSDALAPEAFFNTPCKESDSTP